MTKFIISALGSYGDVHPMVGLGEALSRRGHDVKIIANPYFEDVVVGAGLTLLPISTREHYVEVSQHPDLWHPIRGPKLVLQVMSAELLRPLYEIVTANYEPGETVLCAHGLDFASRTAGKSLGAPLAAIHFAPAMMWSLYDSPRIKGMFVGPRAPQWLKRFQFWFSDTLIAKSFVGRPLNELRRELGLAPVKRIFSTWLHEADVVLGMFPDWFGPPQPDWPANVRLVGFPLWDSPGSVPTFRQDSSEHDLREWKMGTDPFDLSDDVRVFLTAGEAPIAFSPGSANKEAHQFFAAAVEACERLGRRGILLTKYEHQLPARLPQSVRHFGFVPLSKLLPHTAALVHHGGIGTCAQGLAAGVPHLVRPMSFDQFDNARRLVRLGVAEELSVRSSRGATVAKSLGRLLDSSLVEQKCRDFAARSNGPASLDAACDVLEELSVARIVAGVSDPGDPIDIRGSSTGIREAGYSDSRS